MYDKYERVTDTMLVSHDDAHDWTMEMLRLSRTELRERVRQREPAVFLAGIYVSDQAVRRLVGMGARTGPEAVLGRVADDVLRALLIGYELGRRGHEAFYRDLLPDGMRGGNGKGADHG
jgi:hypothetical protein